MICIMPKMSFYFCEIAENRFQFMHDQYGFKPIKCNSASTLSGCIEREMSRVIIALPTCNEAADIFEQTITRGFSLVNTTLAFDTEILPPNIISNNEEEKTNEFKKDCNHKICYNIRLNNEKEYSNKRVITKILKLDENNQYGSGMTKPKTITDWSYKTKSKHELEDF